MTDINNIYNLIADNIKDANQLHELAELLNAEAERRQHASTTTASAAAWPFPQGNTFLDMLTKAFKDADL